MKKSCFNLPFFLVCFAFLFIQNSNAQLGFCGGNSGEAIFTEDFGTGLTDGPELPAGTTTYNFVTGTPNDGDYTISSTTNYFDWFSATDHTPEDTNGKSLIVNASFSAGEFYQRQVTGLCENTTYEFSSWLMNLQPANSACSTPSIPVNVRFQIWDETDTNLIIQGDTGDIASSNAPIWEQYALVFKTEPGQVSVILKMINNRGGGCGNDLAIDDIAFSSCGDNITLATNQNETGIIVCEGQGVPITTLQATPDFSIFTSHAYQWQESMDQLTWTDIAGANTNTYETPTVNNTTYFRAKVAEDAVNLSNDLCNVISDIFEILIVPTPQAPISNGDVFICENEIGVLTVDVPNTVTVNWYDAENGGSILLENSISYEPSLTGTYYAESVSGPNNCASLTRTPILFTLNPISEVQDETILFCEGNATVLSADLDNASYLWNTGETTQDITVTTQGEYSVEITNLQGCKVTKQIIVSAVDLPVVKNIRSDGFNIIITLENSGPFEFALEGEAFQSSPILENIPGDLYVLNISYGDNCGIVSQEYIHLVIPKFFTPNSDNNNDLFVVEGLELFSSFEFSIFNRFGQLLKNINQDNPTWDGTLNGNPVPAGTYWYQLTIEGTTRNGFFALKR